MSVSKRVRHNPLFFFLDDSLHRLARLLVCNFRSLEHGYGDAESILQALRDLPVIPLADGRVVALSGEGVFFPMEETKGKKKKTQAQTGECFTCGLDVIIVIVLLLLLLVVIVNQNRIVVLKK